MEDKHYRQKFFILYLQQSTFLCKSSSLMSSFSPKEKDEILRRQKKKKKNKKQKEKKYRHKKRKRKSQTVAVSMEEQAIQRLDKGGGGNRSARVIHELAEEVIYTTWCHFLLNNMEHGQGGWKSSYFKAASRQRRERRKFPRKECMISTLTGTRPARQRGAGKPYIKKGIIGVKGKFLMIHQLAAWAKHGKPAPGQCASHLCHSRQCANPNHIVWEHHMINISRLTCEIYGRHKDFKCPHKPTCRNCEPLLPKKRNKR